MRSVQAKQRRTERKRLKREGRRRELRSAGAAWPVFELELLPKMSDTLIEFAEPIWKSEEPPTAVLLRRVLQFAAFIWNACQDERGDTGRVVESLRGEVAEKLALDVTQAAYLIEMLAMRKAELFADDPRVVGAVEVYENEGTLRVHAASTLAVR